MQATTVFGRIHTSKAVRVKNCSETVCETSVMTFTDKVYV